MPKSVELFAGGGGMALGMLGAGFEHEQLVEIYPAACRTLRLNAERDPTLWKKENIRETDVRDWLVDPDTKSFEDIDLIAGGPPCQPFSIAAGDNASHANDRNMFPSAIDCVGALLPKSFVYENVPGLLRKNFLPYYEYVIDRLTRPSLRPRVDEDWVTHHVRIKKSRRRAQYDVRLLIIDAADLGVPQTRKRIFLVGVRSDLAASTPFLGIHVPYSQDALLYSQWITGEYWNERGLRKPDMPQRVSARVQQLVCRGAAPIGEPWRTTRDGIAKFPTPVDGRTSPGVPNHVGVPGARMYRGHTGGWIDWPAKTLKAGVHGVCGGEAMIRFSNGDLRYLTVREAAAVQTFPDAYEFPDVRTVAMRLIGNAVATKVAETIGSELRVILEGKKNEARSKRGHEIPFARAIDAGEIVATGRAQERKVTEAERGTDVLW